LAESFSFDIVSTGKSEEQLLVNGVAPPLAHFEVRR
jgi:hypothetical protein